MNERTAKVLFGMMVLSLLLWGLVGGMAWWAVEHMRGMVEGMADTAQGVGSPVLQRRSR